MTTVPAQVPAQPSPIAVALAPGGALHALAAHKAFLIYELVPKADQPGKMDKVPRHPASWRQRDQLLSAEDALLALPYLLKEYPHGGGIGFVFHGDDPFFFLDADGCVDRATGTWSELAISLFGCLPGAAFEVSSSGTGMHLFGTCAKPFEHGCRNTGQGLELYTAGRFVALTGTGAQGDASTNLDGAIRAIAAEYFTPSASTAAPVEWEDKARPDWNGPEDDGELLALAMRHTPRQTAAEAFGSATGKASFAQLWEADTEALAAIWPSSGSEGDGIDHSSADMALASHLAFWTGCNPERMARLMLREDCGLKREKWDRSDYLPRTITGAIASCSSVYGQRAATAPAASGEQPATPASFAPVDLSDIMRADPPPVRFAMRPLLPRRHVTLLGGHGGIGKSSLALMLCAHVAAGTPWAGHSVEQCRVVFASLEDEGALVSYRLRRIIEAYGLDHARVATNLCVLDGTGGPTALFAEGEGYARRGEPTAALWALKAAVAGAGLIVVDNASDAYDADENKRRDVRAFLRELAAIAKANDAAVVLLAHIDKSAARGSANGNSYSGSTAWHNSARSRLALVEDEGRIELRQEKLNLGKKADPVALTFAEHGVLMPAGQSAPAERLAADADAILNVLRIAIGAGRNVSTAESGQTTAWRTLQALPEFPDEFRIVGRGKQRFDAAVVQLQRDGRIAREEYQNTQRKTKERWRVAEVTKLAGNENAGDEHRGAVGAPA